MNQLNKRIVEEIETNENLEQYSQFTIKELKEAMIKARDQGPGSIFSSVLPILHNSIY